MRSAVRVSLCALACSALIVAAAWGLCRWQGVAGELDLAGSGRWLMSEVHKEGELKDRSEAMLHRLMDKQAVIDELFKGGLTLREAGEAFRRLDEEARQEEPDATGSDEAPYRNVLSWRRCAASAESNGQAPRPAPARDGRPLAAPCAGRRPRPSCRQ